MTHADSEVAVASAISDAISRGTIVGISRSAFAQGLVPEPPLEEWLISIVRRCIGLRASRLPLHLRNVYAAGATETVSNLVESNLHRILIAIPFAAPGTNHLCVRFRIDWRYYRHLARAADECLRRFAHEALPPSTRILPERYGSALSVSSHAARCQ